MRIARSIVLPALCCTSAVAASVAGNVYIYEPGLQRRDSSHGDRTLSPVAARLVLAQRAGVEEHHSADISDREVMEAMNEFGSRSSLFGKPESQRQQMVFLVEVPDEHEDAFVERYSDRASSSFRISPPPSASSTADLLSDILQQAYPSLHILTTSDGRAILNDLKYKEEKLALTIHTTLHDLESTYRKHTTQTDRDIIIIAVSPSTTSSESNVWGTYTMPNQPHTHLHKRATPEEPLSDTTNSDTTRKQTTTNLGPLAASPLPGILPACYPSLSSCNDITRNCTGHGSCTLKYTDPSADDKAPSKHCYSCACKPEKHDMGDGKVKTTYWGGPACQKKDISVQFWLISLFVVAMAGLVSFAIGSVWSMGDDELPSVIGAGVSGPVSRR